MPETWGEFLRENDLEAIRRLRREESNRGGAGRGGGDSDGADARNRECIIQ